MKFGDLSLAERIRCFRRGTAWRTGPYVVHARVPIRFAARHLAWLYQDFEVLPHEVIPDAEISVRVAGFAWRRVSIFSDGAVRYRRVARQQLVPLLEWTMNLSVFHRPTQNLLIHAAVVEKAGEAVLLPGEAGSGKSTLCAALVHRGWRLLSDEVAVIRPSDGYLLPVPRPVSLKEGAIEALREFAPTACLGPVWPRTAKGRVAHVLPPTASVQRMDEPAGPAWIVFPQFRPGAGCQLEPLGKADTLLHCAGNAFNYSVLGRQGFKTLAAVIDICSGHELVFDDLEAAVRTLESLHGRRDAGLAVSGGAWS